MPVPAPSLWSSFRDVPITEEMKWQYIRAYRRALLQISDWTHVEDSELTGQDKQAAKDWRHAIRQIPSKPDGVTNPDSIIFPDPPFPMG